MKDGGGSMWRGHERQAWHAMSAQQPSPKIWHGTLDACPAHVDTVQPHCTHLSTRKATASSQQAPLRASRACFSWAAVNGWGMGGLLECRHGMQARRGRSAGMS